MSANADVQIRVMLQDKASANLLRQLGLIDSATGKVSTEAARAGSALKQMGGGVGAVRAGVDATAKSARTIVTGARDANGMFGKMRDSVKGVGREMDGWGAKLKGMGSLGAKAVAGFTAANVVGGAMIEKPLDFDAQAQKTANTAAHDQDGAGKIAEKSNVKAAVAAALAQAGAGNQDDTLALLDTMIAGGMDKDTAYKALPDMLKAQIASGMDGKVLGELINTMANAGIDPSQYLKMMSKGIKTGQMGSFELDSMGANGLSTMVMTNKRMGMTGEQAMTTAMIDLQVQKKATGNDAEAATNYKNFQAKITSADTQKRLKKDFGIDTNAELQKGAVNGKGAMESFMGIADKIVAKQGKGAEFQALVAQLKSMQDKGAAPELIAQKLEAIGQLDRTGILAEILPDMQAGVAMAAKDLYAKDGQNIKEAVDKDTGQALQGNLEANTSTAKASSERKQAAVDTGKQAALEGGGSDAIKAINDAQTGLMQEFPALNAALQASTVAVGLLTAAVTASSVLGGVFGKGGKGGGVGGVLDAVLGGGKGGGKGLGGLVKGGGKALGVVGSVLSIGSAAMTLADDSATRADKGSAVGGALGGVAGGWGGAAMGAAIGTAILPGIGTAVGAIVGGVGLGFVGNLAGDWMGGKLAGGQPQPAISPQQAAAPAQSPVLPAPNVQAQMPAPASEQLIQANAQLQQVNAHIAQLNQVANNERLLAPLGQIQGGIAALVAKPWTFTATIPVYVDGHQVAQTVNSVNGVQAARG